MVFGGLSRLKLTGGVMVYELSEADLDLVTVKCDCGHTFEIPWDAMAFSGDKINCGGCGEAGKMQIIEDPAQSTL